MCDVYEFDFDKGWEAICGAAMLILMCFLYGYS